MKEFTYTSRNNMSIKRCVNVLNAACEWWNDGPAQCLVHYLSQVATMDTIRNTSDIMISAVMCSQTHVVVQDDIVELIIIIIAFLIQHDSRTLLHRIIYSYNLPHRTAQQVSAQGRYNNQWLKCKIRGGGTLHTGLGPWQWSCAFQ